MPVGVSVIVCCYNSVPLLADTIHHLITQKVTDNIAWEIILIDNASTDNTYEQAIAEFQKNPHFGIVYQVVKEPAPGLINARKKGISLSKYEYLIFCDDDNRLSETYVATAFNAMQADPLIGALGGCGILDPEQPAWSEIEKYKDSYVIGPQTWALTDHWVYGAGCVYKKAPLLNAVNNGWYQITTGRKGSKLTAGEDVELCFMLYLAGYKIIANNQLSFKHFIPLKRQNLQYIFKLRYWLSYSYVLLSSYILIIDNYEKGIQYKLNTSVVNALKAAILILLNRAKKILSLTNKLAIDNNFALQSYLGTINSILQNRRKIIEHHKHLLILFKSEK